MSSLSIMFPIIILPHRLLLEQRKGNNLLYPLPAGNKHNQPIQAYPPPGSWWQSIFQGLNEIRLLRRILPLYKGTINLGITINNLPAIDKQLKPLHDAIIVIMGLGQRGQYPGLIGDEKGLAGWLLQVLAAELVEESGNIREGYLAGVRGY